MQVIGKAQLIWDKYIEYVNLENEHAQKREPGWYVSIKNTVSPKIEGIVWRSYYKTGEGINFPIGGIDESRLKDIQKHQKYLESMGLKWEVLFNGVGVAVLRSGSLTIGIPSNTINFYPYENIDAIPIGDLRSRIGISSNTDGIIVHPGVSRNEMKNDIAKKQDEINREKEAIAKLEKEKKEELERIKIELEKKYTDKMRAFEDKKAEMEQQMEKLQQQMFLLDTEIYSIRCFMGETIDFVPLLKGRYSKESEPVIIYQKVRYLDEEMGKWIALYDFDGDDIGTFEQLLKEREDIREIFIPGPKSVSLIKVSKTEKRYCEYPFIANAIDTYTVLHGNMIGILLRDGDNLWIGWTDEDRINIPDDNAFLKPGVIEQPANETARSSTKEEIASRYFIYSILRGIIGSRQLIHIPKGIDLAVQNPYIIFSMADGWLEDNRYGTFEDIVNRTDTPLMKGDMILTTLNITRDDACRGFFGGRNSRYEAWNNDRGRGERNRTHDAHIPNRKVVPVNCVDIEQDYDIVYKKYRLKIERKIVDDCEKNGIKYTHSEHITTRTDEYMGTTRDHFTAYNNVIHKTYSVKGASLDLVLKYLCSLYPNLTEEKEYIWENEGYYTVFDHIELGEREQKNYVSAKKFSDFWDDKKDSFANMQVMHDEYLNLTFLNSIYLEYAIRNRKIGGWRRGSHVVGYTDSIPYLNTALEYIRKREVQESEILGKYMELYDGWQVDLSEWRLSHNYHRLTDARAKKFSVEKKSTGL